MNTSTVDPLALLHAGYEVRRFPEEECTEQCRHEPEVFDATTLYLCVVLNRKWPKSLRVCYARPYIAKGEDDDGNVNVMYGWVEVESDHIMAHREREINMNDEYVVAWKKVDAVVDFAAPTQEKP